MKSGHIDKFDLERIIKSVEHEYSIEPIEKPRVAVGDDDTDRDDSHVVNLKELTCTCDDFKYNCDENQYCKHIYRTVFEKHRMV